MKRVPMLAGSRLTIVNAPDDAVILRPPAPGEAIADVAAAVRDALRFPLVGEPLEALVTRGGRATVVVEPPTLPIPAAQHDPRQDAIAAVVGELERAGVPVENQTLLVSCGLERRPGERELEQIGVVSPEFARRFRGRVEIHDVESPDLVEVGRSGRVPLRVNPRLVETDAIVVVSAAETVLHGGPAALLGAAGRDALRAAGAYSLLETSASQGWQLAVSIERELSRRAPLIGASLTLNHPRLSGAARGYPYDEEALERIARSPLRLPFGLLPGVLRDRLIRSLRRELTVAAAYGGPPSVAHAEALLRGVEARGTRLDGQLDAIVIGVPRTTPHLPRERPNPLLVSYLALGLALRLWRDSFPLAEGGTAILIHRFHRHFAHPTQQPYRTFFQATTRLGREPLELLEAEHEAVADERAIQAYRARRSCHPLLPFADWSACGPAVGRLGAIIVAGCRDAVAARQLGFVPTQNVNTALEMARGRAGGTPRVGFLLSPPYFPLRVGSDAAAQDSMPR
ncbi:MAG TPA: lactate racemase domain-containing protein [Gaiellaceae bacterium]|nr:lactate racemase domain-containing protein [Gaiellaceae bacterium]